MWVWGDGSVPSYTNWAPGHPKPGLGECGYYLGSTSSNGKWYQDKCEGKYKHYICQKQRDGYPPKPPPTYPPHPDGCPGSEKDMWVADPSNPTSDYCYRIVSNRIEGANENIHEVNWKSAREQCRGLGGDLVSFATMDENNAIKELIKTTFPNDNSKEFWIGLGNTRGGWAWTDGSPVIFLHWGVFQPTLFDGHNSAVMAFKSNINGTTNYWEDALGIEDREFICKIRKGSKIPEPPTPPDMKPDEACRSTSSSPTFSTEFGEWYRIGGDCHFVSSDKLDHYKARV